MLIGLSLTNPDLRVKVCELPGALKEVQHLGRTRIWKGAMPERGDFEKKKGIRLEQRVFMFEGPVSAVVLESSGPGAGRDQLSLRGRPGPCGSRLFG